MVFQFGHQIHSQADKIFCKFITIIKLYEEVFSFPTGPIFHPFAASAKKEKSKRIKAHRLLDHRNGR